MALRSNVIDISRSAIGMVRIYGEAAEHEAIARVKRFEKSNDRHGFATWTAIARVIHQGSHASSVESKSPSDSADGPIA